MSVEHLAAYLFDVVALVDALPEYNFRRGQVGTVVEIIADGAAFEVEFNDRDGRTHESLGVRPDQIMPLYYQSLTHSLRPLLSST